MNQRHAGGSKVVLLVGERSAHREEAARAIEARDHRAVVLFAASTDEALSLLAARVIDAVVVDDDSPAIDTEVILSEVQRRPRPPPVVLLSEDDDPSVGGARRRGASDLLPRHADSLTALSVAIEGAIERAALTERAEVSELQYRTLLELSNDAIYILVGEQFRYVNQRFVELFGHPRELLISGSFAATELIHEESRPLVAERSRLAKAQQPLPARYEFKALRKDGSSFDAEVSVSYIHFEHRPAVLGILQDITARKTYEKTLLRKNHELSVLNAVATAVTQFGDIAKIRDGVVERLIELLEVDAAGISILDDSGEHFSSSHYKGASETFVREMRIRRPAEGVLGLALATGKLQVIHDITADQRITQGAAFRESFRSAVALPLITRDRCAGVVSVFTREPRVFAREDIELFVAVASQIAVAIENARLYRKAQEGVDRLQALSEIARAIGSTLDVEGVFRIVGERLQKLVPYRRISLNIYRADSGHFSVRTVDRPPAGEAPQVRLHEPMSASRSSAYHAAMETQTAIVVEPGGLAGTHPAVPARGSRSAVVPIIADNQPMGVFVVSTDDERGFRGRDLDLLRDLAAHMAISLKNARMFQDLDRAYRELHEAKDRVVRSEKLHSLGEMAAGVAHDFNNVLSAILGRAQMLKMVLQDEDLRRSVRVIEKAAMDGAGTVRRIQEFAKEKAEGEFLEVHLNPLVRDAVEMTTTRVNELGIGIEVQVELGEVGPVMANPSELREVLTNLIHNAIDAMPHGGRLTIRTGTSPAHRRSWFEVGDTGIGMDEDTQRKLFDPFFTTKGTRGTGLGLSVSYGIVQRHRGEFQVASERGRGSLLRVLIPSTETAPDFGPKDNLTPLPQLVIAPYGGETARILVIDDDVAVRDVLADILRTGDHHVVSAGSGEEGLALFSPDRFDVVFTDLGMPGMNGWEVAKGVKAKSPTTPVGLITGFGSNLDEAKLLSHGVDLVVSKPFRFEQVLALVTKAMSLRGRFA